MKRVISLLLTLSTVFLFISCAGESGREEESSHGDSETVTEAVETEYSSSQPPEVTSEGDDFCDVTYVNLTNVMQFVTEKYVYDFYEVPNIDLKKDWWDHNAEDKFSFNNHLYYTFNDHIFNQMENCRAVFFNKELARDLGVENLYDAVRDKTWTIDKMFGYAEEALSDLDGDTKFRRKHDRFGVINWGVTGLGEALLTGCDSEIVKKGEDGNPYFYCYTERFAEIYKKVLDCVLSPCVSLGDNGPKMFKNQQALFMLESIVWCPELRDMEADFGIIPCPKLDEEQEKYWDVSPNPHTMIIPSTVADIAFAGAAAEELAYQSRITLLPSYYENLLKGKVTRDSDSIEMLDLIHSSVSYVIKIIGTEFSDAIYSQMKKKNYDIASMLEKWRSKIDSELDDVLTRLQ